MAASPIGGLLEGLLQGLQLKHQQERESADRAIQMHSQQLQDARFTQDKADTAANLALEKAKFAENTRQFGETLKERAAATALKEKLATQSEESKRGYYTAKIAQAEKALGWRQDSTRQARISGRIKDLEAWGLTPLAALEGALHEEQVTGAGASPVSNLIDATRPAASGTPNAAPTAPAGNVPPVQGSGVVPPASPPTLTAPSPQTQGGQGQPPPFNPVAALTGASGIPMPQGQGIGSAPVSQGQKPEQPFDPVAALLSVSGGAVGAGMNALTPTAPAGEASSGATPPPRDANDWMHHVLPGVASKNAAMDALTNVHNANANSTNQLLPGKLTEQQLKAEVLKHQAVLIAANANKVKTILPELVKEMQARYAHYGAIDQYHRDQLAFEREAQTWKEQQATAKSLGGGMGKAVSDAVQQKAQQMAIQISVRRNSIQTQRQKLRTELSLAEDLLSRPVPPDATALELHRREVAQSLLGSRDPQTGAWANSPGIDRLKELDMMGKSLDQIQQQNNRFVNAGVTPTDSKGKPKPREAIGTVPPARPGASGLAPITPLSDANTGRSGQPLAAADRVRQKLGLPLQQNPDVQKALNNLLSASQELAKRRGGQPQQNQKEDLTKVPTKELLRRLGKKL